MQVVHLKKHPDCFKVDRSSYLGNPFELTDESLRDKVCKAHKDYVNVILNLKYEPQEVAKYLSLSYGLKLSKAWKKPTREQFISELNKLKEAFDKNVNLKLGCWCAPKQCHASNYIAIIEDEMHNRFLSVVADNLFDLI